MRNFWTWFPFFLFFEMTTGSLALDSTLRYLARQFILSQNVKGQSHRVTKCKNIGLLKAIEPKRLKLQSPNFRLFIIHTKLFIIHVLLVLICI